MGGRGSANDVYTISVISTNGFGSGKIQPLNVAGMTPMDRGSRFTSAEKTLGYLENKKLKEPKEQLQVLDDYGYVTRAFQGDEHSVCVDDSTREYMNGKIVTHNHPDEWGGTFSDADIYSLRMGMKELRASAKEGTYIMRAGKKKNPVGLYDALYRNSGKIDQKMRQIAYEVSRKKWKSKAEARYVSRKEQIAVIHEFYKKTAEKYGYTYIFEERGNSDE